MPDPTVPCIGQSNIIHLSKSTTNSQNIVLFTSQHFLTLHNPNGLVERSDATILSVLTNFILENKEDWDTKLPYTDVSSFFYYMISSQEFS